MKTLIEHKGMTVGLVGGSKERTEAIDFISRTLFKKYNNSPDPATTPEILFAAWEGTEIIGAMGLEFGGAEKLLPYEGIYQFDQSLLPFLINRENTAYYCRLTVSKPQATRSVIQAATQYALEQGKTFGASVLKPSVARCMGVIGIELFLVEATLNEKNILASDRKYYLTAPRPQLYLMDLTQVLRAVHPETW